MFLFHNKNWEPQIALIQDSNETLQALSFIKVYNRKRKKQGKINLKSVVIRWMINPS